MKRIAMSCSRANCAKSATSSSLCPRTTTALILIAPNLPHAPRDAFEHLRQHVNAGHGFETLALEAVYADGDAVESGVFQPCACCGRK
jgi:hypothetical protein